MAEWVAVTEAVVVNALPTDLAALHTSWIGSNPDKAGRLAELTAETVAVYRDAVAANPANEVDEDPTKVPMAAYRHVLNTITFNLGMEMGIEFAAEVYSLISRAEIWLRGVQIGSIPVGNAAANASPSYTAPDATERTVQA